MTLKNRKMACSDVYFDEGNEEQLASLKAHADDSAYEVKLQIEMAISRIENGDEALGSVWKQIANRKKITYLMFNNK